MKWLRELERQLHLGGDLCTEMHRQLAPVFEQLTQENLDRFTLMPRIVTMPPRTNVFTISQTDDGASVTGELLNVDTLFPVEIVWTQRDGAIRFRWEELPVGDIRDALAKRRDIPLAGFAFPIAIRDPIWPHVRLTFAVRSSLSDQTLAELGPRLVAEIERWNAASRTGQIHRVGAPARIDERSVAVVVDFGSAGVEALEALLHQAAQVVELEAVTLDS